ncbi:MAG: class I SAM-dependent methyltransferase [Deltaproteobacteria bacterium]|nr:class I SAM-dependent methyltransferase [Deltaproteobacteria bacterium]
MTVAVTDTAAAVARVRAWEAELPEDERLFDDPHAHLFVGGTAADEVTGLFLSAPLFREAVRLRTRFIDDAVRAALGDGIRQILILGVGFDCRALRLDEIATCGAIVFEVDYQEQLAHKAAILGAAGVSLPLWARSVPCDFTADDFDRRLTINLAGAGFDRGAPVVIVWEGVVSYLNDEACDRSLRWMAAVGGAGSRLVFNYTVARFDPARLPARIAAAGFARLDDADLGEVHRRYLPGEPPGEGELYHLAVAWR